MKKSNLKRILIILGLSLVLLGAAVIYASPGTSSDPLVSLSYLQKVSKFNVITVKAGKTLIGKEGTEIVLRSGSSTIYSPVQFGVSDVTAGKDLLNGQSVPLNHLLIIPRDGRGIKAKTESVYMIKGEYTIK